MKRIAGIFLAALLALTVLPHGAELVTSDDVTKGIVTTAYAEDEHKNHCICGATHKTIGDHTSEVEPETWTGVRSLDDIKEDGYYYLTKNVELSYGWSASYGSTGYDNNVVLCLNGHSIGQSDSAAVISVSRGCTITITDCEPDGVQGEIKHVVDPRTGTVHYHHGVYITYGTFNMYGGRIAGNTSGYVDSGGSPVAGKGGGVSVGDNTSAKAVFNMYGGTITGNTADQGGRGGGVYVWSGSGRMFNMYGGTISGNAAKANSIGSDGQGGGVYVDLGATFNMIGGTISGNTADCGGGVYVGGTLNLSGDPVVKDNTKNGGSDNDNVAVSGGTVNVAGALAEGAAVVVNSDSTSQITGSSGNYSMTENKEDGSVTLGKGTGGSGTGGETTGHVHAWSASWTTDETAHWHECTAENCDVTDNTQKSGYAVHTAGDWETVVQPTDTTDGKKQKECTECGYVMGEETIPATGGSQNPGGEVTPGTETTPRYYYNASTAAEGKTGSPKTFDAGVGIYAVSAVLSLSGMAYVGKKKF